MFLPNLIIIQVISKESYNKKVASTRYSEIHYNFSHAHKLMSCSMQDFIYNFQGLSFIHNTSILSLRVHTTRGQDGFACFSSVFVRELWPE